MLYSAIEALLDGTHVYIFCGHGPDFRVVSCIHLVRTVIMMVITFLSGTRSRAFFHDKQKLEIMRSEAFYSNASCRLTAAGLLKHPMRGARKGSRSPQARIHQPNPYRKRPSGMMGEKMGHQKLVAPLFGIMTLSQKNNNSKHNDYNTHQH